jgi:glutathione synthase
VSQRLLFICDPLVGFATYKDTTYAMMVEAQRQGAEVYAAMPNGLSATATSTAIGLQVSAEQIQVQPSGVNPWWKTVSTSAHDIRDFDVVLMRKDPPFDQNYFVATQLLDIAVRLGVRVVNAPDALRNHGEKMAALEFPEFTPPTLVSSHIAALKEFASTHQKIVIKPLDAMGGTGIFVLTADDPNLPSALELLTNTGRQAIVAQRYLPAIVEGDKRIIVINGIPVDFALARIPQPGQSRGNLAAGGKGVVVPLTPRDREIATAVGKKLLPRGLFLLGLDVIGDSLTEINVTSPTGFQEIKAQSGTDVAALFINALFQST